MQTSSSAVTSSCNASSAPHEEAVNCMLCGEPLVYSASSVKAVSCVYCKLPFETNVACAKGHFVCDTCHSKGPNDLIESACAQTTSTDPLEIATLLMKSAAFHQNGPEHHYLVPAVLVAAYCNTVKNVSADKKAEMLKTARERAQKVPGGVCGYNGACGGCQGAGIALSVITGSTPLSKKEWGLANRMTGHALLSLGELGGPRCCKRSTFNTILMACAFIEKNLGVKLAVGAEPKEEGKGASSDGVKKPICDFYMSNQQCIGRRCPFSKKASPEAIEQVKHDYQELCGYELF